MRRSHSFFAVLLVVLATVIILSPGPVQVSASAGFAWRDAGGGRIELLENGKPVLVYNYGPQLRSGLPEERARCCYLFPLYTAAGVSMLEDFPEDHLHHRGLFWAWPVVEFAGKQYDLWMAKTARHRSIRAPLTSATSGEALLEADNRWLVEGRDIVRESLKLRASPSRGHVRDIAVELTWEALAGPVVLRGSREAGKSYGGFNARFARRDETVIRADGLVLSKDEDLVPHQWAELEGVYEGRRAILRIALDEVNPRVPWQWCLRKYGFIGASFPGRTEATDGYTLELGAPLTLRFRVRASDVP